MRLFLVVFVELPERVQLDAKFHFLGALGEEEEGVGTDLSDIAAESIHTRKSLECLFRRVGFRSKADIGVVDLDISPVFLVMRDEAFNIEGGVCTGVEAIVLESLEIVVNFHYIVVFLVDLAPEDQPDEAGMLFENEVFLLAVTLGPIPGQNLQRGELFLLGGVEVLDGFLLPTRLHMEIQHHCEIFRELLDDTVLLGKLLHLH